MNNIEKRYKKLTDTLTKTQIALQDLVKECPHESMSEIYFSDTGNYDPRDDSYSVNITCNHCHGKWTIDQRLWRDLRHKKDQDKSKALREYINVSGI